METDQTIKVNTKVKWKHPELDDDNLVKLVVEDNGDRVILMEIGEVFATWRIKPQFVALKADLVKVDE